jgi:hypothetical protein
MAAGETTGAAAAATTAGDDKPVVSCHVGDSHATATIPPAAADLVARPAAAPGENVGRDRVARVYSIGRAHGEHRADVRAGPREASIAATGR